jgi:hypothetical protein
MDVLTLSFVGLLVVAAIFLTLNVRAQILRAAEARRQRDQQQLEELRRRNSLQGNPRSATRGNR